MKWMRESVKRVAETERLVGDLKLAIKMNNEAHFDGFFRLIVESVQRTEKSSSS